MIKQKNKKNQKSLLSKRDLGRLKIALVHDYIKEFGGAEAVFGNSF
jgi:hypothetical protein